MRSGPGKRYPVRFTYTRRGLPMEVIDRYENWRRIRDPSGEQGWIRKELLSNRRMLITLPSVEFLFKDPNMDAEAVARVSSGVIGKLGRCPQGIGYCQAEIGGFLGWLPRDSIWGVHRREFFE